MKVMIVDDSSFVRKGVGRILEKLGHEVSSAVDGADCLEKVKEQLPDAILMDWNMPVMDGFEALLKLRSNPDYAGLKILMMTTENSAEKIEQAMTAGADEYIMKPFTEDILQQKLDSVNESFFL